MMSLESSSCALASMKGLHLKVYKWVDKAVIDLSLLDYLYFIFILNKEEKYRTMIS